MSTGGRGQLLMPWPNRIRDGAYAFDGRGAAAGAHRAGAAQRLARPGPLGGAGRWRSTPRPRCRWATG